MMSQPSCPEPKHTHSHTQSLGIISFGEKNFQIQPQDKATGDCTSGCHVQSWLSCTILIVMYNPDCHVQSWCTILIVMYNPDCHVQSWLSCTILIVMYNPETNF